MGANRRPQLTRREREILDVIFRLGEASVGEILEHLPRAPTSGAVRRLFGEGLSYSKHVGTDCDDDRCSSDPGLIVKCGLFEIGPDIVIQVRCWFSLSLLAQ